MTVPLFRVPVSIVDPADDTTAPAVSVSAPVDAVAEALHQTRHEFAQTVCLFYAHPSNTEQAAATATGQGSGGGAAQEEHDDASLDTGSCALRAEAYREAGRLRSLGVASIDSLLAEFMSACETHPALTGVEVVTAAAEVYARVVSGDDSLGVKYRVADLLFAAAALSRSQGFTVEEAMRERTRLETLVRGVN